MSDIDPLDSPDVATAERTKTKKPPLYKVLLLNDDYTSMEFVVFVLQRVFHKSERESNRIMLTVHHNGSGVAGIFTKEIAETKIAITHQLAQQNEFPLKCTMEPE